MYSLDFFNHQALFQDKHLLAENIIHISLLEYLRTRLKDTISSYLFHLVLSSYAVYIF